MTYPYDEDSANTLVAEERAYKVWERERKNYILSLTDSVKKQKMWRELFPKWEQDETYLENNDGIF